MSVIRFFDATDTSLHITEFGFSTPQKHRRVGPWVRNTFLLHYVVDGVCHFDGFDAPTGTAFLIAKDRLHTFAVDPPYTHYWFSFDGDTALQLLSQYHIPYNGHHLLRVSHPTLAETLLQSAFSAAAEENGAAAAESALFALLPLISEFKENTTPHADTRIQDAAKYMEIQYSHDITMENVAAHIHLSEKHFCKRFKVVYGIPPHQFLKKVRMRRAAQLLTTTDLLVGEIAKSVGFASPLYFSNAFHRFFGVSPTVFRVQKSSAVKSGMSLTEKTKKRIGLTK